MRLLLVIAAFGCAIALPMGSAASACLFLIDEAPAVSASQRVARAKRLSNTSVERRLRLARAALAAGADPAAALAEMVVPNVRPVLIHMTSCGPLGEIDRGEGVESSDEWLAGTPYAGRLDEFASLFDEGGPRELPGRACNSEFRGRFAAHLRSRLAPRRLRAAYLFLGARWETLEPSAMRVRLTAFQNSRERRPPLRWGGEDQWQQAQIARWVRRDPDGRAFQQAMDAFWQENAPLLGDLDRTCPAAAAVWAETQANLVAAIRAEEARRAAPGRSPGRD